MLIDGRNVKIEHLAMSRTLTDSEARELELSRNELLRNVELVGGMKNDKNKDIIENASSDSVVGLWLKRGRK
jgi:hypothetical protein